MTEPFSGYTTMYGWSILVFCLFACVIVEQKVRETLYKVGLFGGWLLCMHVVQKKNWHLSWLM